MFVSRIMSTVISYSSQNAFSSLSTIHCVGMKYLVFLRITLALLPKYLLKSGYLELSSPLEASSFEHWHPYIEHRHEE